MGEGQIYYLNILSNKVFTPPNVCVCIYVYLCIYTVKHGVIQPDSDAKPGSCLFLLWINTFMFELQLIFK